MRIILRGMPAGAQSSHVKVTLKRTVLPVARTWRLLPLAHESREKTDANKASPNLKEYIPSNGGSYSGSRSQTSQHQKVSQVAYPALYVPFHRKGHGRSKIVCCFRGLIAMPCFPLRVREWVRGFFIICWRKVPTNWNACNCCFHDSVSSHSWRAEGKPSMKLIWTTPYKEECIGLIGRSYFCGAWASSDWPSWTKTAAQTH